MQEHDIGRKVDKRMYINKIRNRCVGMRQRGRERGE